MPAVSANLAESNLPEIEAKHGNTTGIDDDIQRRDSLHALINSLPDAHYATLRAVILVRPLRKTSALELCDILTTPQHLNKIQEHYTENRMNAGNLAICFGYVPSNTPCTPLFMIR